MNDISTTRIFVIFGIFVVIVTVPLLFLYVWNPAMLGRFISLVENIIIGLPGAYIVALALDFTIRRRQERAMERVARVGLSEASQAINRMMSLFAGMVKASSDGFIPSTIEDLFGTNATELISFHLGLDKRAPVFPEIPWQDHITREAKFVVDNLTNVQERYQAFLPGHTLAALGTLRNNSLFHVFGSLSNMTKTDALQNIKRPVLNIPPENLQMLMDNILVSVKTVQQEAKRLKAPIVPSFPSSTFRDDVKPDIGDARFEGQLGPGIFIGKELPISP